MILKHIHSGLQNGVDQGGVKAAKECGIGYSGLMPKGFRTLNGNQPSFAQLYNAKEHASPAYPPRTEENVKTADGTIRIAQDFQSAGEICTWKAIQKHDKPYFDVVVQDTNEFKTPRKSSPEFCAEWIINNKIEVLNVAGNSENTAPGIGKWTERYISSVIRYLQEFYADKEKAKRGVHKKG